MGMVILMSDYILLVRDALSHGTTIQWAWFKTVIREIEKLVNRAELASENTSLRTKAGNNI